MSDEQQIREYARQLSDAMLKTAFCTIVAEQARRAELYKKVEADATSKKEL